MSNNCREAGCRGGPEDPGRHDHLDRRTFLEISGLGALGALAGRLPGGISARRPQDGGKIPGDAAIIPADKALDPDWVASLTQPGRASLYRGKEIEWIGMPVGGLCAGQVYLGGDGKLWHWDIFNEIQNGVQNRGSRGGNYVHPLTGFAGPGHPVPALPFDQGFAVHIHDSKGVQVRRLDRSGFRDISFEGRYPIGTVHYRDAASPVAVTLEAFSPFIPLDTEASSYPATVMGYRIENRSDQTLRVELGGWLENAICINHRRPGIGRRQTRAHRTETCTLLLCSAVEPAAAEEQDAARPDIPFDDFESDHYQNWTVTGTAFGDGPVRASRMPAYQGDVGCHGERLVNSHNTRSGEDVRAADAHTGQMLSRPFVIERNYVTFLIGGGSHDHETCIDLLVDGEVVGSATGRDANRLRPYSLAVHSLRGRTARLRIVDAVSGGWGNVGIDQIVFSDQPRRPEEELRALSDFGTMALALVGDEEAWLAPSIEGDDPAGAMFAAMDGREKTRPAVGPGHAAVPLEQRLVGALGCEFILEPGRCKNATFIIAWHFPNLRLPHFEEPVGRWYATRFASAAEVALEVARDLERLRGRTRLWVETWYDSSLPGWFLERTFVNTSTLATSTCHRFANGRFYGWEGVGCCEGTCTHVWHYAQAPGRLFPDLERDLRERVDLGIAFDPETGKIGHRGELNRAEAHDGQAGIVLQCLREHQMSADSRFLQRNWPRIKKAVEFLMMRDGNGDGLIEGAQPNTLDAAWWGKIAWLASLYLAALRAAEVMARDVGDEPFAARARAILERGRERIVELWNGEYFIQLPDPAHKDAVGAYGGCYIDQVIGQGWAFQVGMGRLYDETKIRTALRSLWRYNFTPDVGPFKRYHPAGRPFAVAGEGGLLMGTWPRGNRPRGFAKHWQEMYFNECMTGFEYQAAGHMLWEGMVTEGLAITRAIHDRYRASRRNPFNEIECSDHYARAMASYGVYLAACGFEWNGPAGRLAFAPRLGAEAFRAAFTASEGWGRFTQRRIQDRQSHRIDVRWGRLRLRTLAVTLEAGRRAGSLAVRRGGDQAAGGQIAASLSQEGRRVEVTLAADAVMGEGETIEFEIQC